MQKVKLKPFESLNVAGLVDINAVKNVMTISNFTAKPVSMSATTTNITNPYKDGLSVATASSDHRKGISETKQVKGRFEIKYN